MQISPYGKRRDLEKVAGATRCPRCKSKDGFADGRCLNCHGSATDGRPTPKMESPEQMETLEMEGVSKGAVVKVAGFKGAMQSEFEMMQDPTRQRGPAAPKAKACESCLRSVGFDDYGRCKGCGEQKDPGSEFSQMQDPTKGPKERAAPQGDPRSYPKTDWFASSDTEVKVAGFGDKPRPACPICAQDDGGKIDPKAPARMCPKHKEKLDRQFKGQGSKEPVRDDPRSFGGVVGVGKVAGWADALVKVAGSETISFGWNLNFQDEEEADVTVTAELEPHVPQSFDSPAEGGGVYIEKIVRDSTGEEVDLESVSDETYRELEDRAREASGEKDEGLRGAAEEAKFQEHRDEPRGERELGYY